MNSFSDDHQPITETIQHYFLGTYHGNAEQLKQAFHPDAFIIGNLNDETFAWSLTDFISRVTTKPTAAEKNEPYSKEIIFIDQTNDTAMVKARVVVGSYIFTDYITLLKINGKWLIRNKSFTAYAA